MHVPSAHWGPRIDHSTAQGYPYIHRTYQPAPIMIEGSGAIMNITLMIEMNIKHNL